MQVSSILSCLLSFLYVGMVIGSGQQEVHSRAAEEKPFVTLAFCGSVEVQLAAAAGEGQALAVEYSLGDPWGVECARDAANRRPPAPRTRRGRAGTGCA